VHRHQVAHRHIGGGKAHRYLERRVFVRRGVAEAQLGQFAAHQVLVAAQLQRVFGRRRLFEDVGFLGRLAGPLVEGGYIALNRRCATGQEQRKRCRRGCKNAFHLYPLG